MNRMPIERNDGTDKSQRVSHGHTMSKLVGVAAHACSFVLVLSCSPSADLARPCTSLYRDLQRSDRGFAGNSKRQNQSRPSKTVGHSAVDSFGPSQSTAG